MNASPWLLPAAAGKYVSRSTSALKTMRYRGIGPVYHKINGRVYYSRDDLDAWIASGRRDSTPAAPRATARRRRRVA
jgi:hypothetical protein